MAATGSLVIGVVVVVVVVLVLVLVVASCRHPE